MARTLAAEDPRQVAFELMNEPIVDCDSDGTSLWPDRQQKLFAAARSSATKLTLILTGACYSNAASLAKIDPKTIPDDNIIWTFHSYDPFLLTHQGATWAGDFIPYVTGLPYPLTAVPRAELDVTLDTIRARIKAEAPWTRQSGLLAYLDEQVASMDTDEKLLASWTRRSSTVEAWAKANGIKPENITLGEFGMIRQEYGNAYVMPAAIPRRLCQGHDRARRSARLLMVGMELWRRLRHRRRFRRRQGRAGRDGCDPVASLRPSLRLSRDRSTGFRGACRSAPARC